MNSLFRFFDVTNRWIPSLWYFNDDLQIDGRTKLLQLGFPHFVYIFLSTSLLVSTVLKYLVKFQYSEKATENISFFEVIWNEIWRINKKKTFWKKKSDFGISFQWGFENHWKIKIASDKNLKILSKCFILPRPFQLVTWPVKVHIFWEGHKILRNLQLSFD